MPLFHHEDIEAFGRRLLEVRQGFRLRQRAAPDQQNAGIRKHVRIFQRIELDVVFTEIFLQLSFRIEHRKFGLRLRGNGNRKHLERELVPAGFAVAERKQNFQFEFLASRDFRQGGAEGNLLALTGNRFRLSALFRETFPVRRQKAHRHITPGGGGRIIHQNDGLLKFLSTEEGVIFQQEILASVENAEGDGLEHPAHDRASPRIANVGFVAEGQKLAGPVGIAGIEHIGLAVWGAVIRR